MLRSRPRVPQRSPRREPESVSWVVEWDSRYLESRVSKNERSTNKRQESTGKRQEPTDRAAPDPAAQHCGSALLGVCGSALLEVGG